MTYYFVFDISPGYPIAVRAIFDDPDIAKDWISNNPLKAYLELRKSNWKFGLLPRYSDTQKMEH
jgi:hypothetical protein